MGLLMMAVIRLAAAQDGAGSLSRDGAWEIGLWAAEGSGAELGGALGGVQMSMAGIRYGRVVLGLTGESWRRGTLEYTFDAIPFLLTTRPQLAHGGSIAPLGLKWNFDGKRRLHPYIEMSGGAAFTTRNVPPGRTDNFNFTATVGSGVMLFARRGQAVSMALRYWHLSNANLGVANPSFNTLQLMIGYSWIK